jgi:hypothetical protein
MPDSLSHPASAGSPVKFVIVTIGRTGSTWLRMLLDSHPMVTCHGELFGENLSTLAPPGSAEHVSLLLQRQAAPATFMVEHAFAPGNARAVGFKILFSQLTARWPGLLDALQADSEVRVIHLVRRNGLKRFLSEYFVGTITKRHQLLDGEAPPAFEPVELPIASLLQDLEMRAAQSARIRDAFAKHPFLEVSYEDMLDGIGPVLDAAVSFLGLPAAALSAGIRKVLPDDVRRLVTNYSDIERALAATPYRSLLE